MVTMSESAGDVESNVAGALIAASDIHATVWERLRLRSVSPKTRRLARSVAFVALLPVLITTMMRLPVAPALILGAIFPASNALLFLDLRRAPITFTLRHDGTVEVGSGSLVRRFNVAEVREHCVVEGVGDLLRAPTGVVILPERVFASEQLLVLRGALEAGVQRQSNGGTARWNVVDWASPTTTMPHRPSTRPAVRGAFLILMALPLAAYTLLRTHGSSLPSDQMIEAIAISAAIPLLGFLGLLSDDLQRLRAAPASQSCTILDGSVRVATHHSSTDIAARALMSVTRTSGGIDLRYHGGLLCLPRGAFRDRRHRDEFAARLRQLRINGSATAGASDTSAPSGPGLSRSTPTPPHEPRSGR